MGRRPIALLTGGTAGGSHARIAHWLRLGFERIGEPFDSVHVESPPGVERLGSTRVVRLGANRLRSAPVAIHSYLRSSRPELVLATPIEVAVVALAAAERLETRIAPWEQTMARIHVGDQPRRYRLLPLLQRLTYNRAAGIAVTSEDVATDLMQHLGHRVDPERIAVIRNPIDSDEIRELSTPPRCKDARFRFCAIGRLTRQKGYDLLLSAVAEGARELPADWELVILGNGPLETALRRKAARLGVADHIQFMGYVTNPYPVLASADVFVHPARWEGFGLVLAEALALGIPIVATSCSGGPREILDGGRFGRLVPPGDPAALARALVEAATNRDARREFARIGPERARNYAPEVVARAVIDFSDRLQPKAFDRDSRGAKAQRRPPNLR